jgi:hypothetical protein
MEIACMARRWVTLASTTEALLMLRVVSAWVVYGYKFFVTGSFEYTLLDLGVVESVKKIQPLDGDVKQMVETTDNFGLTARRVARSDSFRP